jgi:hypothetical protein
MSGVEIICTLLRRHGPLTAIVPAANIRGGSLGDGDLGILVRSVSLIDFQTLVAETLTHSTERVSATIRATSYRDQRLAIRLIRAACKGVTNAAIGEATGIAVLTAGTGPDANGPGDTFEQAQDFRVSFNAPA